MRSMPGARLNRCTPSLPFQICSKPLKGKRAGPASGSPTEEAFRRLGDAIQVRHFCIRSFHIVELQSWDAVGCRTWTSSLQGSPGGFLPAATASSPISTGLHPSLLPLLMCSGHAGGLHCGAPAGALLLLPRVHERRHAVRGYLVCSLRFDGYNGAQHHCLCAFCREYMNGGMRCVAAPTARFSRAGWTGAQH